MGRRQQERRDRAERGFQSGAKDSKPRTGPPLESREGERLAAERARERIQARLKQLEAEQPPVEFRFTMADQWSRHLFVALLRRYGVQPYRYRGRRRTTVMARIPGVAEQPGSLFRCPHRSGDRAGLGGEGGRSRGAERRTCPRALPGASGSSGVAAVKRQTAKASAMLRCRPFCSPIDRGV
ncbi:MAG: hypothetical protein ACKO45_06775 [Cyanobium sp.]